MVEIIAALSTVPSTIWAGIGGATIAFTGVIISNRGNTIRQRVQLQHDAIEKAKDRTANMRREVYLKVVEEITIASGYLGSLAGRDLITTDVYKDLQGLSISAAKVQIVAENETALLTNELGTVYGELLIDLMGKLAPLQETRTDIEINTKYYDGAQSKMTRVLDKMAELAEGARVDTETFEALQRAFSSYLEESEKYAIARGAAWDKHNSLVIEFNKSLMLKMRDVAKYHVPMMVSIRKELGLTADIDIYMAQMEKQWQVMDDAMRRSYDAMV